MDWLLTIPLAVRLTVLALVGIGIGGWVNWAIYRWAWTPRDFSPWSPAPAGCPSRTWPDRVPIFGWPRMRREVSVHGRGFWIRPLLIELFLGLGLAWLYWWEVDREGLVDVQLFVQVFIGMRAPSWVLHANYLSHAILVVLMTVASFIDIDEKTIPDRITDPGTLLGLLLATLLPMSLLPQITVRPAPPVVGVELERVPGAKFGVAPGTAFIEPVTCAAPNDWPAVLAGAPAWRSLALGLGCYALWCFAIVPRIWRGRRGPLTALRLIGVRVARAWRSPPLARYWLLGLVAIPLVWWRGGNAWIGLLSALVGMIGSGGIVWAVRIAGTFVLRREAMGFGDVTLMMMVGAFLGWQAGIVIFFLAPLAGVFLGLLQLILRHDDVIPFGPILCLATVVTIIVWGPIWTRIQQPFQFPGLVPAALVVCMVMLVVLLYLVQLLKMLFLRGPGSDA
jgi:prepilin signal peptidase PulO-like enzyme (type II secretory pathway)